MLSMSYPIFLLLTSEGVLPKIFSISIHCCSAERHLDIWGFIFTPLLSTFLELIALCLLVKLNIIKEKLKSNFSFFVVKNQNFDIMLI